MYIIIKSPTNPYHQPGTTALMRAAQEGHQEVVEALLGQSADVNKRNHERMNALMLASQRGHDAIVKMLIDHGALRLLLRRVSVGVAVHTFPSL